jgi:adenylate cyclase
VVGGEKPGAAELEAAGLYDPDAADAPERLALLEYLVELGATIDDLVAEQPDELPVLALSLGLWPDRTRLTLAEAAERAGVDEELLRRVWRASGFVDPGPDMRVVTAADVELYKMLNLVIDFVGEDAMVQFVRVLGAAADRVADAAVSLFVVNVGPARMQADPSGLELARANAASLVFLPGLVSSFDLLLRHRIEASRRPIGVDVAAGVEVQRRSVGFADLVGSTALAQQLDMRDLGAVLSVFDGTASEIITAAGGRVVKLIGDEVMFTVLDAKTATEIALALVDAFERHDLLPPVRVGVASGDVVTRDGDYAGTVVNLAARAVNLAQPNSLLVDRTTRDALSDDAFRCEEAGVFSLKGFTDDVPLYRVTRSG